MAKVLEFLTVNVAVKDLNSATATYRAMGLAPLAPNHMPVPPAQITDVTVPLGAAGSISLIAPTDDKSPVASFLAKRGEGMYSIAIRVDDLKGAMREWSHLAWVLPEPAVFPPGTPACHLLPERLLANWVKPKSLNGFMLEVFELQGEIKPFK